MWIDAVPDPVLVAKRRANTAVVEFAQVEINRIKYVCLHIGHYMRKIVVNNIQLIAETENTRETRGNCGKDRAISL